MRAALRVLVVVLVAGALAPAAIAPARAATIVIINSDGPGEGFNDPTPAAPVGGNPGTTVGAQRLYVLQYAANLWGSILPSTVVIQVESYFDPLPCTAISGVLGSCGPKWFWYNFYNAQYTNTWYSQALAHKQAGGSFWSEPDIWTWFNSAVGATGCLETTTWYYGLDSNEGTAVEMLPVALHELGHGLGFLSTVDDASGMLWDGRSDIYTRFLYDNAVSKYWDDMTDAEREASAINGTSLVWDGPNVMTEAPNVLAKRPQLTVNAPGSIAGAYTAVGAGIGGVLSYTGVSAPVVLADDGVGTTSDACEPLVNGAEVAGNIVLIDRGNCRYADKAQNAEDAGAAGVIFVDNVAANVPPAVGGSDATITFPLVSVTMADGDVLKAELGSGLDCTIGTHATELAGVDGAGRVRLFSPDPLQSGSSVSHWDISMYPKLLMEPSLSGSLTGNVDLTEDLFRDLGWFLPPPVAGVTDAARPALQLRGTPNPFHASSTIDFALDRAGWAELEVLDAHGRRVRQLLRATLGAGPHSAAWDGRNDEGRPVPTGVYLLRLTTPGSTATLRTVRLN